MSSGCRAAKASLGGLLGSGVVVREGEDMKVRKKRQVYSRSCLSLSRDCTVGGKE